MAEAVAEGAKEKGAEVSTFTPDDFEAGKMDEFDAVAFGCPAMGDEVLEETIFEPMFDACKEKLKGKRIALFGSYGWGDGEWMRNCGRKAARAKAPCWPAAAVTCADAPDDEASAACRELGAAPGITAVPVKICKK